MTTAQYVIYLLLTISWSKNVDDAAKPTANIATANPQMEKLLQDNYEDKCYPNEEVTSPEPTEVVSQYNTKSLFMNILSSNSRAKNTDDPTVCYHTVNNYDNCPRGLETFIDDDNIIYCYELKCNQIFPTTCKYPHPLPYDSLPEFFKNISYDFAIWQNIFRNTSSRYPNFVSNSNDENYGTPLDSNIENKNALRHNCAVRSNKLLERVSCSARYASLCVYSYNVLQSPRLSRECSKVNLNYTHCVVSDFNLFQPTCFCKKLDESRPEKQKFCSKLAEPIYVYQNRFLKQLLYIQDKNVCWMGMYKELKLRNSDIDTYHWLSTKDKVGYTDWIYPYDCKNSEGAFDFDDSLYEGRWILRKDGTLNCALCEVTLVLKKPILTLTYNRLENRIDLKVENFYSVRDIPFENIYCFSDFNEEEFTIRVDYKDVSFSDNIKHAFLSELPEIPGRYWCAAFEFSSDNVIKSNTILAYSHPKQYSNEFVITVKYYLKPDEEPFVEKIHVQICETIKNDIIQSLEKCDSIISLRPVSGKFHDEYKYLYVNCYLTTNCSSRTMQEQYNEIDEILHHLQTHLDISIESFRSVDVCLRDSTFSPDNQELIWPTTVVGASAIPINVLCLDKSLGMLPVTRKCLADVLDGAKWDKPKGNCYNDTEYSETTNILFNLAHGNVSTQEVAESLLKLTEESVSNEPIDVHLATSALERASIAEDERINEHNFSAIINNMMNFDKATLKVAQSVLNSTDRLLSLLDSFIVNINQPWIKILPRLVIQISDLKTSNIRGLAMYKTSKNHNFQSYEILQLYTNTSFENVIQNKQLDTSVLFPSEEVNKIKEEFPNDTPIMLVIVVFYDDILFQETNNESVQQSKSKVVGVTVPGYKKLSKPIKIALRTVEKYENKKDCSFWKYGLNDEMVSFHGEWQASAESETELLEICEFDHMTHFGLLIKGDLVRTPDDLALNIISAVGSALSLIGIVPIFLTAIMFKSWRNKAGNVILINFCIAITIQIALMFSLYAITEDGIACKAIAACLHYIAVSEFCWMFVVAMLQYRRFVLVFTPQESNIIVKCLIVGWLVPLLPVVVTLSASIQSYSINAHNFCIISGNYLLYAHICPIIFILICNIVIFVMIIYSVSRHTAACVQKSRTYKLQILLALFLFFVLGLTWIFGFLGALTNALWLTYIFCITATLRGIVLFLFFIVGNEETLLMWKKRATYYVERKRKQSKPTTSDTGLSIDL